jgi:prolyl-tRNA synthetase
VVGRGAPDGIVELKDRRTGERQELVIEETLERLSA